MKQLLKDKISKGFIDEKGFYAVPSLHTLSMRQISTKELEDINGEPPSVLSDEQANIDTSNDMTKSLGGYGGRKYKKKHTKRKNHSGRSKRPSKSYSKRRSKRH